MFLFDRFFPMSVCSKNWNTAYSGVSDLSTNRAPGYGCERPLSLDYGKWEDARMSLQGIMSVWGYY